jgi:hypothetical protein
MKPENFSSDFFVCQEKNGEKQGNRMKVWHDFCHSDGNSKLHIFRVNISASYKSVMVCNYLIFKESNILIPLPCGEKPIQLDFQSP